MTRLLIPVLLVVAALLLVPRGASAPAAELSNGVRLFGYHVRVDITVAPVHADSAREVIEAVLPDSAVPRDAVEEVVP